MPKRRIANLSVDELETRRDVILTELEHIRERERLRKIYAREAFLKAQLSRVVAELQARRSSQAA